MSRLRAAPGLRTHVAMLPVLQASQQSKGPGLHKARLSSCPGSALGQNWGPVLRRGALDPPSSEKLEAPAQWPRNEGVCAAVSALFLLMASASLIFAFLLRLQRIRNLATVSDWGGWGTKDLQPEKGLRRACGDSVGVEEWLLLGEGPGPS